MAEAVDPPGQLQRHVRHHPVWGAAVLLPHGSLIFRFPRAYRDSGIRSGAGCSSGRAFQRTSPRYFSRRSAISGFSFRIRSLLKTGRSTLEQGYVGLPGFIMFHFPILRPVFLSKPPFSIPADRPLFRQGRFSRVIPVVAPAGKDSGLSSPAFGFSLPGGAAHIRPFPVCSFKRYSPPSGICFVFFIPCIIDSFAWKVRLCASTRTA